MTSAVQATQGTRPCGLGPRKSGDRMRFLLLRCQRIQAGLAGSQRASGTYLDACPTWIN